MSDTENTKKPNSELHTFGGVLLITVDNALFGANALSIGLSTPLTCLVAFLFTGIGVFLVQKYLSEDDTGPALAKGFGLGILAGVPTSIAGTVGGIYFLDKAGIKELPGKNINSDAGKERTVSIPSKNKILNIALLVIFLTMSYLIIKHAF